MKQRIYNSHLLEFFDDSNNCKAIIKVSGSDLILNPVDSSGTVIIGEAGAINDIEVGDAGTSVDFTFLGGGTFTSNGGTLVIGCTGDTIDLSNTTIPVITASIFQGGSFNGDGSGLTGVIGSSGTPADNQIAVFTDSSTLEGTSGLTFDGSTLAVGGNITANTITAEQFNTSIVSASVTFQSGSTQFGDSGDDLHRFTGSIKLTGGSTTTESGLLAMFHGAGGSTDTHIKVSTTGSSELFRLKSDSNNHTDLCLSNAGTARIGLNTYWPAYINNSGYSSRGGLVLGSNNYTSERYGLKVNAVGSGASGSLNVSDVLYVSASCVGIGTSTPERALEVRNASGVGYALISGTTGAELRFRPLNAYSAFGNFGIEVTGTSSSPYTTTMNFTGFHTNETTVMTLKGDCKVGIGTSSPSCALHVAGNGLFTGGLTVGDSSADTLVAKGHSHLATLGGRVGIGTTTPTAKLNVKSSGSFIDGISLTHSGNTVQIASLGQESGHGSLMLRNNSGTAKIRLSATGSNASYFNAGNVGIGTTSPSEPLDVVGTARMDNAIVEGILYAGDSVQHWGDGGTGMFFGTDEISLKTTSGTTALTVDSSQNVGIGITSPSATFHISSSDTNKAIIEGTNGSKLLRLKRTDTDKYFDLSLEGNDLRFNPGTCDNSQNVLFGVNAGSQKVASRVGIGQPDPATELDVSGSITVGGSGHICLNQGCIHLDGNGAVIFDNTNNNNAYYIRNGGTNAATLQFGTGTPGSNIKAVMDGSGNFALGTTNPNEKLTVAGNISASGEVNINIKDALCSSALTVGGDAYSTGGYKVGTAATFVGKMYNNAGKLSLEADTDRDIQFGDAGTAAVMYIDNSAEKIGIGTTSPTMTLDLRGNQLISGSGTQLLRVESSDSSLGDELAQFKHQDGTNNPRLLVSSTTSGMKLTTSFNTGIAGSFDLQANGGSSYIALSTNGTNERMRINSSGKVGIGTTVPSELLAISASSNPALEVRETGGAAIKVRAGSVGRVGTYSNNDLSLVTNSTDQVRISTGGKVGIGTTSPTKELHIQPAKSDNCIFVSASAGAFLGLDSNAAGYQGIQWDSKGTGCWYVGNYNDNANLDSGDFAIIRGAKTNGTPAVKFDTSRNARFTANVTVSGSTILGDATGDSVTIKGLVTDLPSSGQLRWGSGDAEIREGLDDNYSLSIRTYDGSTLSTAIKAFGNNDVCIFGDLTVGSNNTNCSLISSSILGGHGNCISGSICDAVIAGGSSNTIKGRGSFIGTGDSNQACCSFGGIVAGRNNTVGNDGFIGAGRYNEVCANTTARCSGIVAGSQNKIQSCFGFIGAGCKNNIISTGCYAGVVAGLRNSGSGCCSFIGAGVDNKNIAHSGVVGGGCQNVACQYQYSFIGGGACNCICNTAQSAASVIVGGFKNTMIGSTTFNCNVIVGGACNSTFCNLTFIGGGCLNKIEGCFGFIGGGISNLIFCNEVGGTIGGGRKNCVCGDYGTIAGGFSGSVEDYGFIGGGYQNMVCSGEFYSTIAGGLCNRIDGDCSTVGGGRQNYVIGNVSTVGGGYLNYINVACCSTIAGGYDNEINTTSGWHTIGGGSANCIITSTNCDYNTIAGGQNNFIRCNVENSTIGGGASNCICSTSGTDFGSTIAGGAINKICNSHDAFIGGGCKNCVCGSCRGVIVGGLSNEVKGDFASILGGCRVSASHSGSAMLGGCDYKSLRPTTAYAQCLHVTNHLLVAGGQHCPFDFNENLGGKAHKIPHILANHSIAILGGCNNHISTGSIKTGNNNHFACYWRSGGPVLIGAAACSFIDGAKLSAILSGCGNKILALCAGQPGWGRSGCSFIGSGVSNCIVGNQYSAVLSGNQMRMCDNNAGTGGAYNLIGTGFGGCIKGGTSYGVSLNGYRSRIESGSYVLMGTGYCNCVKKTRYSTVINGICNAVGNFPKDIATNCKIGFGGNYNTILNGNGNIISGSSCYSVITAGQGNKICGATFGGIIGGSGNRITGTHNCTFIIGTGITATAACYTFVNNLCAIVAIRGTTVTQTSALRHKECIQSLQDQLDNVKKLNPVRFRWKNDCCADIGFIAEEVEKIYPELISYEDDGEIHGLSYAKLTTVLVKAIQKQQEEIDELKTKVNKLSKE